MRSNRRLLVPADARTRTCSPCCVVVALGGATGTAHPRAGSAAGRARPSRSLAHIQATQVARTESTRPRGISSRTLASRQLTESYVRRNTTGSAKGSRAVRSTGPRCRGVRSTSPHAAEFEFYFRGCTTANAALLLLAPAVVVAFRNLGSVARANDGNHAALKIEQIDVGADPGEGGCGLGLRVLLACISLRLEHWKRWLAMGWFRNGCGGVTCMHRGKCPQAIVAAEKLRVITRSVITRNYCVITRPEIHYTKGVEK